MHDEAAILARRALEAPPAPEPEGARALADRQMARLERLADVGMEVVEAVSRQANSMLAEKDAAAPADVDPSTSTPVFPHLDLAFARISRAVRMTLTMQTRVFESLQAMERARETDARIAAAVASAAAVFDEEDQRAADRAAQREAEERAYRLQRIEGIVGDIAEVDHAESAEAVERFVEEARERLDDGEEFGDLLDRPISEVVEQICKDLGLTPDWLRLDGEVWALEARFNRVEGAPLAAARAQKRAARAQPGRPPDAHPPPYADTRSEGRPGHPCEVWPPPERLVPTWLPGEGPPNRGA